MVNGNSAAGYFAIFMPVIMILIYKRTIYGVLKKRVAAAY
jgi:hypothetical protein